MKLPMLLFSLILAFNISAQENRRPNADAFQNFPSILSSCKKSFPFCNKCLETLKDVEEKSYSKEGQKEIYKKCLEINLLNHGAGFCAGGSKKCEWCLYSKNEVKPKSIQEKVILCAKRHKLEVDAATKELLEIQKKWGDPKVLQAEIDKFHNNLWTGTGLYGGFMDRNNDHDRFVTPKESKLILNDVALDACLSGMRNILTELKREGKKSPKSFHTRVVNMGKVTAFIDGSKGQERIYMVKNEQPIEFYELDPNLNEGGMYEFSFPGDNKKFSFMINPKFSMGPRILCAEERWQCGGKYEWEPRPYPGKITKVDKDFATSSLVSNFREMAPLIDWIREYPAPDFNVKNTAPLKVCKEQIEGTGSKQPHHDMTKLAVALKMTREGQEPTQRKQDGVQKR